MAQAARSVPQAQLAWLPAGMMTLVMVFTTLDPVSQSWFRCLPDSAQHDACEDALHTANVALAGQKFCELPAGVWEWTRRCGDDDALKAAALFMACSLAGPPIIG